MADTCCKMAGTCSVCLILLLLLLLQVSTVLSAGTVGREEVKESEPLSLSCNISASDTFQGWYKVKSGQPRQLTSDGTRIYEHDGTLYFSAVTREDSGLYKCGVNHQNGISFRDNVELKVIENNDTSKGKARLQKKSDDISVLEGKHQQIMCIFAGSPLPEITWYHNGNQLTDGVESSGMESSLTFTGVTSLDEGVYTCKGNNSAGTSEGKIELSVIVPPKPPASPTNRTIDVQPREQRVGTTGPSAANSKPPAGAARTSGNSSVYPPHLLSFLVPLLMAAVVYRWL